ncbi:MAG: GAF domain-containing protein, partial [Chromatiales bacterium]|nr:GAF domain-containing protein [Chromatiales bacterium]
FTMSMLTATEVSRSAARLVEAMDRVEHGDLSGTLYITGTDEYADIYRGFNLMTESLRDEVRMLEVSHDLSGEIHLDVLLERIMGAVTELLDAERSTLFLYDANTDELWSRFASGLESTEIRIPAHQGIAGAVLDSGITESIADPYADSRFNQEIDIETGFRTRSILCAPIAAKNGKPIGVTQVLNKHDGEFTAKDETRLLAFTAQIAVSLQNAQLFEDVLNMKNYNESILRSTSNGMLTLNQEEQLVTANDAAKRILRLPDEGLTGMDAPSLFGQRNSWLLESIGQTFSSGETDISMDTAVHLSDGDSVSANISVQPLRDASEGIIGTIVVLEDLSGEKRVKATMARYMSKEVVDQLLAGGDAVMGGTDQVVSILFSDVRGFTSTSESMGARETVSMLNEYFEEMVDVVFRHDGILDKYIGDAIMALFGAPFAGDHDADNAVAVANGMMTSLRALNTRRVRDGRLVIEIGVGVSTGMVVAGNIGSTRRMEYTVIGDSVNLASRLEGVTKMYGTPVLMSQHTVAALTRPTLIREIDFIRVKGKDEPVAIYEGLEHHTPKTFPHIEESIRAYATGLEAYRQQDWRAAAEAFRSVLANHQGDVPSQIFVKRCEHYATAPPSPGWDGVWTITEK